MAEISLVFPHQLYGKNPSLHPGRPVWMVEEHLFFQLYKFHKHKIIFHRASMKSYKAQLTKSKLAVNYINASEPESDVRKLGAYFKKHGIRIIHTCLVHDDWLQRRLTASCEKQGIQIKWYDCPGFLCKESELPQLAGKRRPYFQTDFYIQQRKRLQLLLEENGKPVGGKWSFDAENRLKYPKSQKPPNVALPKSNEFLEEAINYTNKFFKNNPGNNAPPYLFSINRKDALKWLDDFIQHRFESFGEYEDAIVQKETILHHSVLTPMLNVGIITPQEVLDTIYAKAVEKKIPLNSLEGFTRQIIGWREFIRMIYTLEGRKQRTTNYWKFNRKIPASFYNGTTGIVPIDTTIKKILETGYCHHIERLMVLGNFMLLCEFDPNEVYKWFMELFIDAYDWVMVPNVYGMTQFADGGLMTTKPYISGSNYLMKMSDYPKGKWQETWDGLFWRFMHKQRSFFLSNPRLGMLVKTFDKMSEEKKALHLKNAEDFLKSLK